MAQKTTSHKKSAPSTKKIFLSAV